MPTLVELDDEDIMTAACKEISTIMRESPGDGGNAGVETSPRGIESWIVDYPPLSDEKMLEIAKSDYTMIAVNDEITIDHFAINSEGVS